MTTIATLSLITLGLFSLVVAGIGLVRHHDNLCNARRRSNMLDAPDLEAEVAEALTIWFDPRNCIIVWSDGPEVVHPLKRGKRLSDLKPGDIVEYRGEHRNVHSIENHR